MPCGAGGEGFSCHRDRVEYIEVPSPLQQTINEKLKQENQFLEAGLCAIIRELDKRNISHEVINDAMVHGKIDLMNFWVRHSQKDEVRIAAKLEKFSDHEKEILKQLLNKL